MAAIPCHPEDVELILTYVPEAEHLTFDAALSLAHERDWQAAEDLLWSIHG